MVKQPTFEKHDKLNRHGFAQSLTKSIERFYLFSDDAYVLSLDAPFGSGKTMFVKMWRHYLHKHEPDKFETIYFNAWKHDYFDNPTIPLLIELLKKVEKESPEKVSPLKKALAVVTVGLDDASKQLTGISPLELGEKIKELSEDEQLAEIGGALYEAFKAQQEVMSKAQEALSSFVETLERKPLFIFIDELDRARPDYAVKLLETLKHLFGVQGVCFVLAVDKKHLASSVKTMFGSELDFENYYKKFVTRQFTLPSIEETNSNNLIEYCFFEHFDEKQTNGIEFPFEENAKQRIKGMMHYLAHCFELTPRQIKEYFRTLAHFTAISHDITGHAKPDIDEIAIVCLIHAIEVKHPDTNQQIVSDKFDERDLEDILQRFVKVEHIESDYGNPDFVYVMQLNFIISLCHDGNTLQMSQLLSRYSGNEVSEADIRTHIKGKNSRFVMPTKAHVSYRLYYNKMRHWKPFII